MGRALSGVAVHKEIDQMHERFSKTCNGPVRW